jgi:hypothetical protein
MRNGGRGRSTPATAPLPHSREAAVCLGEGGEPARAGEAGGYLRRRERSERPAGGAGTLPCRRSRLTFRRPAEGPSGRSERSDATGPAVGPEPGLGGRGGTTPRVARAEPEQPAEPASEASRLRRRPSVARTKNFLGIIERVGVGFIDLDCVTTYDPRQDF